ncbi:Bax inhibitor-1/YccA family protein [Actinacidiphila acidipaludis]|uniref:Bax inhibitor-1/YccA family protein n=1 Tax=Actinacidiphila acidipaludis TaxID=2873382 RepID=A0ABS7Q2B4_9ACTN|nr:Bax inhibitor-1/YccA family protein [Streptomyces acidipaludis]MBY8876874.1 Bax inhibitor-1/YccA family protein [Streptomyces acidipaludis]
MRSSNPVFSRRGFTRGNEYAGFGTGAPQGGNPQYSGNPYAAQGGGPAQPRNPYDQAQPLSPQQLEEMYTAPAAGPAQTGRMTMDDVVVRTAMTLGTVVLGVVVGWFALGDHVGIAFGAAFVAFVLAMVQSFKRVPSPALILGYAIFEGVFLGVLSRVYNDAWQGAPVQAVLGTMAVFAGMLIAYKARIIRVTARYQRIGMAMAIGFILAMFVNLLFAAFGSGDGLGLATGGLGIVFALLGIALGAFFLSLDFKQVEDGIRYGAPRNESWLAAFGLTLSLVWIYLELLRLIAILRD